MSRTDVIKQMQSWLGTTVGSVNHLDIINTYNNYLPQRNPLYTRATKMITSYDWCAATVSAALIKCGYAKEGIFYPECSCGKLINSLKAIGSWVEDESVTPEVGWLIFYDWDDTGAGDCTKGHDHVGIVETVSNGTITTIEGNYNKKCQRRCIKVNGRYIRGYGAIKYDDATEKPILIDNMEYQNDLLVWNTLMNDIGNEYGVAGVMGNLKAESCIRSNNLQDSSARRLGITDEEYTLGVDTGAIDFCTPVGYGICQWTSTSRKKKLKAYTDSKGVSISDLQSQVEFLLSELKNTYSKTYLVLKMAESVEEASTRFMYYYEAPASRDKESTKTARAKLSQTYFDKYAEYKPTEVYTDTTQIDSAKYRDPDISGTYKTTINLNLRVGASSLKNKLCVMPKGTEVKCYSFYSIYMGKRWYLVQAVVNNVLYTGFCNGNYLEKQ